MRCAEHLRTVCAVLAVLAAATSARATSRSRGIHSDIAVDGDRVRFCQLDGSTVLDLRDGHVVERELGRLCVQRLRGAKGILPGGRLERSGAKLETARWQGGAVTLTFDLGPSDAEWVAADGPRGRWTGVMRGGQDHRIRAVHPGPGVLLVERVTHDSVTLECLEEDTGRARWLYVFPAFGGRAGWDPLRGRGLSGTVQLDWAERPSGGWPPVPPRAGHAPYEAPIVLDPRGREERPGSLEWR